MISKVEQTRLWRALKNYFFKTSPAGEVLLWCTGNTQTPNFYDAMSRIRSRVIKFFVSFRLQKTKYSRPRLPLDKLGVRPSNPATRYKTKVAECFRIPLICFMPGAGFEPAEPEGDRFTVCCN